LARVVNCCIVSQKIVIAEEYVIITQDNVIVMDFLLVRIVHGIVEIIVISVVFVLRQLHFKHLTVFANVKKVGQEIPVKRLTVDQIGQAKIVI